MFLDKFQHCKPVCVFYRGSGTRGAAPVFGADVAAANGSAAPLRATRLRDLSWRHSPSSAFSLLLGCFTADGIGSFVSAVPIAFVVAGIAAIA